MKPRMGSMILLVLVASIAYSQLPSEREMQLGQQMEVELASREKSISDAEVIGFVQRVLDTLSRNQALRLPLKLKLIDTSELVASALPGGVVVFSSGAILQAGTEAELAGLLSHAMGHVQAGQFSQTRGPLGEGKIPLVFIGGRWGICQRSVDRTNGHFLPPTNLAAQGDLHESQADMLGLGYMTNAGYDPQALVSVFEHWEGKSIPDDAVKSEALALANVATSAVLNTSAFDQIKERLAPPSTSSRRIPTLYR